jgi:hypothetical protein
MKYKFYFYGGLHIMKKVFSLIFIFTIVFIFYGCSDNRQYEDIGIEVEEPYEVVKSLFEADDANRRDYVSLNINDDKMNQTLEAFYNSGFYPLFFEGSLGYTRVNDVDSYSVVENQEHVTVMLNIRDNATGALFQGGGYMYFIIEKNPKTNKSYIVDLGIKINDDE